MIKVLIVDDEILVTENIKASFNWEEHGFQVIEVQHDGLSALDAIDRLKPDIVLTDVRMPVMDGIELISQASKSHPDTKFVIISGYADFSYAKQAMDCGAAAYCLKPLKEEELKVVLLRLKASIMLKEELSFSDLTDIKDASLPIYEVLRKYRQQFNDSRFMVFSFHTNTKIRVPKKFSSISMNIGLNKEAILIESSEKDQVLEFFREYAEQNQTSIGYAGEAYTIGELLISMEKASELSYGFFIFGKPGLYCSNGSDKKNLDDSEMRRLGKFIENKDARAMQEYFSMMTQHFLDGSADIKDAYKLYNYLVYLNSCDNRGGFIEYAYGYDYLVKKYTSAEAMCNELFLYTIQHITNNLEIESSNIKNKTIKKVVEYINNNFWNDITIQSIAELFYFNPSYLCQLFKKETGKTLMEYVIKMRIDYACQLISTKNYKVSEVCTKVGYYDYYHFNKIFKSIVGKTPNQYMKEA